VSCRSRPLEWDGSLGAWEQLAIDRLPVECLSNLVLVLGDGRTREKVDPHVASSVVLYQGTPPHLAGSLLTIIL
jgi:hypothetical protein